MEEISLLKKMFLIYLHTCILVKYLLIKYGMKLINYPKMKMLFTLKANLDGENFLTIYFFTIQTSKKIIYNQNLIIFHGRKMIHTLKNGKLEEQESLLLMQGCVSYGILDIFITALE